MKPCKDCVTEFGVEGAGGRIFFPPAHHKPRPAPHPGPRCATHHRAAVKAARARAHETRVGKVYGLPPGAYEALYEAQQGVCALCLRATGKSRKLAVDHDHSSGLVRGLLCYTDNKILGHLRDDPEAARRLVAYLLNPPAKQLGLVAYHQEKRSDDQ